MTIEVTFRAEIKDKDYAKIKADFEKAGAQLVLGDDPEVSKFYGFEVRQVGNHRKGKRGEHK